MINPYEPPQSKLGETTRTRPVPVWIISIYLGISVILGIIGQLLLQSGAFPLPEEQAAALQASALDWVFIVTGWILAGSLSVTLFRMMAIALPICIIWMVLGMVGTARVYLENDYLAGAGLIGIFVGALVVCLVTIYVYRLKKRGLLR